MPIQPPVKGQKDWADSLNNVLVGIDKGKADAAYVDSLNDLVQSLRDIVLGISSITTYTYEEGVSGEALEVGNDILVIHGNPKYSSAAAKHGGLGIEVTSDQYGAWQYVSQNVVVADWRAYVQVVSVGNGPMNLFHFVSSQDGTTSGSVRLRSGGSVAIYDTTGNSVLSTEVMDFVEGQWMRVDCRQMWDGIQQTAIVRTFITDPEGDTPDEVISAAYLSALPNLMFLGNVGAQEGWHFYIDTVSYKPGGGAYIPAYQPSKPDLVHTFDNDTDSPMVAGVDDIKGVTGAPAYSTVAAKHGVRGVVCSTTAGGRWQYLIQNPDLEFQSVYLNMQAFGTSPTDFIEFQAGSTMVAKIRLRTSGGIGIASPGGTVIESTTNDADAGNWVRIDYKITYNHSASNFVLTARYFYPSADEGEGTTYEEISGTFNGAEPDNIWIGTDPGWTVWIDTHRTFPHNLDSEWPEPYAPIALTPVFSLPGAGRNDGCDLGSYVNGGASTVDFGYSTTADGTTGDPTGTITYVGAQPISNSMVKHHVAGAASGTKFYGKLASGPGNFIGEQVQFKTFPADNTAFDMTWAYASCQGNQHSIGKDPAGNDYADPQLGWKDLIAFAPDLSWFTGDFGYWGGHVKSTDDFLVHVGKYVKQAGNYPYMVQALMQSLWDQMADDHEIGDNNTDSYNNPIRAASILAMMTLFGMYPQGDTGSPMRGLYGGYPINNRISVWFVDNETMDRSPWSMDDTEANNKTFLGGPQDTWLQTNLAAGSEVLNILIWDKSFLGTAIPEGGQINTNDQDKIWNYGRWRTRFIDFANSTTNAAGRTIADTLCIFGGDRHANGYASKATVQSLLGLRAPVWLGSGISQHALPIQDGEDWDWSYGYSNNKDQPVMQYIRGHLIDDNAGTITLSGESREVHDTWDTLNDRVSDPAGWSITEGGTASDTWTY